MMKATLATAALLGGALALPQSPTQASNQTATQPAKPKGSLNAIDSFLNNVVIAPGPAPTTCAGLELIVARGTSEFGPYGFFVGDPLVKQLKAALPDSQGSAVDYPASAGGNTYNIGADWVRGRLLNKTAQCPDMKFALSGYSQGASIIRAAFQNWTMPAIDKKIVAVVLFGDPGLNAVNVDAKNGTDPSLTPFPEVVYKGLFDQCNTGDPVCSRGTNFLAHVGYGNKVPAAVQWIVKRYKGEA